VRDRLLELWNARDARERALLSIGGIVAIVLILYLLVWDPITSERERLLRELPKLRAQAAEFRQLADEAESLKGRAKSSPAGQPLSVTIESSAKQANLGAPLRPVQSMGADRVQVSGNGLQFDALIRWIALMATSEGIVVEFAQATAASEPGRVQLDSLILKR
jgi:general secretion pathway protein M